MLYELPVMPARPDPTQPRLAPTLLPLAATERIPRPGTAGHAARNSGGADGGARIQFGRRAPATKSRVCDTPGFAASIQPRRRAAAERGGGRLRSRLGLAAGTPGRKRRASLSGACRLVRADDASVVSLGPRGGRWWQASDAARLGGFDREVPFTSCRSDAPASLAWVGREPRIALPETLDRAAILELRNGTVRTRLAHPAGPGPARDGTACRCCWRPMHARPSR